MSYSTVPATQANRPKQDAINKYLSNGMALLLYPRSARGGAFPPRSLVAIPRMVPPHRHQTGEPVQPDPLKAERQSQRRDDCSCYLCKCDEVIHGRLLPSWACMT